MPDGPAFAGWTARAARPARLLRSTGRRRRACDGVRRCRARATPRPSWPGDAVYVSYAIEHPQPAYLRNRVRVGLLVLAWALLATTLYGVARRCKQPLSLRGLGQLAGIVALAAAMALLVMYGENALDFDRALERGWMAAVLSLVLALVLIVTATGSQAPLTEARTSKAPLYAAAGLIALSVVAYLAIPDRAHAFGGGPLHPKSLFLLAVILLPLFLGLTLGALQLRRRRPGLAMTLGLPGLMLALAGIAVLAAAVLRAQGNTRTTVSTTSPYIPHLHWWLPVACLGAAIALLALRRAWPKAILLNALTVIALVALTLTGLGFGLEHLIARVPYLTYTLGNPYYAPILRPWVAFAFAGAAVLALAGAIAVTKLRPDALPGFGTLPVLLAVLLGAGCFAYILYVPRDDIFDHGLLCLDRDTGAIRWQTIGVQGPRGIMHSDNSGATPTPVTDGERIYACFGTPGVMAVDRAGRLLWTYSQLAFSSTEGVSSSPIVWQGKVIVLSESQAGQWLVTLEGATGKLRWKTPRRHKMHMYAGNCRTPLIWPVRGRPTIIIWGLEDVNGYDPDTGAELWSHQVTGADSSTNPVDMPVADDQRLYLAMPNQTVALALDKLGQPGSPVVWSTECADGSQCPTPVLGGGMLFSISDNGGAYCVDTKTGKRLWYKDFAYQAYASPIRVGNRIYFTDTRGLTQVVAAEPAFRLLARNTLNEPMSASMAPVEGRLYVRTGKAVWCLE